MELPNMSKLSESVALEGSMDESSVASLQLSTCLSSELLPDFELQAINVKPKVIKVAAIDTVFLAVIAIFLFFKIKPFPKLYSMLEKTTKNKTQIRKISSLLFIHGRRSVENTRSEEH